MSYLTKCSSALCALGVLASACGRQESGGVVALIRAIDEGDASKLAMLLEAGIAATPPGSPLSPIHAAITHFRDGKLMCDTTALKLLLDHDADPNFIEPDSGFAPLEDAVSMGDVTCATLLKDAGANLNGRGKSGQSILNFAVKGSVRTGDTSILKLVLSWGVDPNTLDSGVSSTALHAAAWVMPTLDAASAIGELLRSGTDPCLVNGQGDTALDVATYLERPAAIRKLLADSMTGCGARASSVQMRPNNSLQADRER